MTRKWFLGLLGIGAAGQEIQESHPIYTIPYHTVTHQPYKPKNGECPVCGTMAPKYVRDENLKIFVSDGPGLTVTERLYEPATRTVSCTHCRVRFDQEAEDAK